MTWALDRSPVPGTLGMIDPQHIGLVVIAFETIFVQTNVPNDYSVWCLRKRHGTVAHIGFKKAGGSFP